MSFGALVRRRVGEIRRGLLGGRDAADGIEIKPPQELLLARLRIELLSLGHERRADEVIDLVGRLLHIVIGERAGAQLRHVVDREGRIGGHEVRQKHLHRLPLVRPHGDDLPVQRAELRLELVAGGIAPGVPRRRQLRVQRRRLGRGCLRHRLRRRQGRAGLLFLIRLRGGSRADEQSKGGKREGGDESFHGRTEWGRHSTDTLTE